MNKPHGSAQSRDVVLLVVSIVLGAGVHGAAQSQRLVTKTELVVVDIVALDKDRKPVTDLRESDFRVFEDGHERSVSAFSVVDVLDERPSDLRRGAGAFPAVAGVSDQATSDPSGGVFLDSLDEGRLVLIVFDRTIPVAAMPAARAIARTVVDRLGPRDLAAVLRTTSFADNGVTTDVTGDRDRLRAAIASPSMGATAPPVMTKEGLRETTIRQTDSGECICGTCAFDRIAAAASTLTSAPRLRKMMFLIASDMPDESARCLDTFRDSRARLYRQLDLANLTVHVFDPLGLETDAVDAAALPGTSASARRSFGQDRRASLATLPKYTGGRLLVDRNQAEEQVEAALDESRLYYLVGFDPKAPNDGKDHRIEVRVRDSRVKVLQWRKYYQAALPVGTGVRRR